MELTLVGLLSKLLRELFTPANLDMFLASHTALSPARGANGTAVAANQAIFLTAEALIQQKLVPHPLVELLHKRFPYQKKMIDDFTCGCLVLETADQLVLLAPERLTEWSQYEAPSHLKERLKGKSKDAATIAAQLPGLRQRDRDEALCVLVESLKDHTSAQSELRSLIPRWAEVAEPTMSTLPQTGTPKPVDANDLRQFVRTLDRLLVWWELLDACQRPAHQLLVVRGDPEQSLGVFCDRVRLDLSKKAKPHIVRTFGPGKDHSVATTAAGWEELLCEAIGHAELCLSEALLEDTQRKPALYIVGPKEPLHLGDGGLIEAELSALVDFILKLPAQLPALGASSPVRLLLPVQVDAALGADDPVFRRIEKAVEAAAANDPRGAVRADTEGALKLPDYDELRRALKERAGKRPGHTLNEVDWAKIRAAHTDAVARGAPFTAFAEAIWRALPLWMQEP